MQTLNPIPSTAGSSKHTQGHSPQSTVGHGPNFFESFEKRNAYCLNLWSEASLPIQTYWTLLRQQLSLSRRPNMPWHLRSRSCISKAQLHPPPTELTSQSESRIINVSTQVAKYGLQHGKQWKSVLLKILSKNQTRFQVFYQLQDKTYMSKQSVVSKKLQCF